MAFDEMAADTAWRIAPSVVIRKIADETILVPISGNLVNMQRLFTVNEVGASVLSMLDGQNTVEEIHRCLLGEFDVDETLLKNDLFAFIDQLKASSLIIGQAV